MKIIITGAAGFIGTNLSRLLIRKKHTLIGIDNLTHGYLSNISEFTTNKNFTFIKGDIKNFKLIKNLKADLIVHLASQKIPRYTDALETLDENILMVKNVVKKCLQDKIKLVMTSTSDVYGKNPILPYTENSDLVLGPTKVKRWAYAISKIYAEHFIIANHEKHGLNYSIARLFGSYGPHQNLTWWGGPQSVFIQNILEGKPLEIHGNGQQTRTFTYVEDTVAGIFLCCFHPKSENEIFNVANYPHEEITIKKLANLICDLMHLDNSAVKKVYIPYTKFGNYEDVIRRVPNIDKISNLGFKPRYTLREGLIKTIQWQKKIFQNR